LLVAVLLQHQQPAASAQRLAAALKRAAGVGDIPPTWFFSFTHEVGAVLHGRCDQLQTQSDTVQVDICALFWV
jgi:hypothetical protein